MEHSSGLILYTQPGCPFSAKVLLELAVMGIEAEERNIAIPAIEAELMAKGGEVKTPYLIDTTSGHALYESDDIISYLHERFGKP